MEKFVLITGASSGLGKKTAITLAQNGYTVFAGVRKEEDKTRIEAENTNITAVIIDVTDKESIQKAFETIKAVTTELDALINNAGIALAGPVEFLPQEVLKKQFDVNVYGAINVAQQFLPMLKKGKIINLSSMASFGMFPFVSPYCASKRALDIFFNALLLECKLPDLQVISIKPGVVKTEIWDKSIDTCEKILENMPESAKEKYHKEYEFLSSNAKKNNDKGLEPQAVANLILKVMNTKHPKLSYTIGTDAKLTELYSCLPLRLTNFITKLMFKKRVNKNI